MNVVPKKTTLVGSFRCFDVTDLTQITTNLKRLCKQLAKDYQVEIHLHFQPSSKPVVNDPTLVNHFKPIVQSIASSYDQDFICYGSEDFGEYLQYVPGVFFFLGCNSTKKSVMGHSSKFRFDEKMILVGSALLTSCTLHFLSK